MQQDQAADSLQTIQEIRNIMERSARFLSLSGWSGIWAGSTALVGAYIAYRWLPYTRIISKDPEYISYGPATSNLIFLALSVFIVALAGGFFFTWRKGRSEGVNLWNSASRQFLAQLALPILAGAIFCIGFIYYGHTMYLSPACLIFYGLALINASKFTLSDIRYLGALEVGLGCINLFVPEWSLYLWAAGFGLLHILYGIIMWNKYDKKSGETTR